MEVTLSITTKISAKYKKLTQAKVLSLAQSLLPGKDMVKVVGGKYKYMVVWQDNGEEKYGEWVAHPLGTCRMCGVDTFGSGEYCSHCLQVKLDSDDRYYSPEACRELVSSVAKPLVGDNSQWAKERLDEIVGRLG